MPFSRPEPGWSTSSHSPHFADTTRLAVKVPGHRMHVPSMNRPDGTLVTSDKRGFGSTSATFRGYGVPFVPWAEGDARKMPPPKAEALPIWQFQSSKVRPETRLRDTSCCHHPLTAAPYSAACATQGTWVPYSAEESKRIEAAKRGGAEVLVVGGCPINLAKMVVVRCPQTVTALRDVTEGEGERLRAGQQVVVLTVEGDGSLVCLTAVEETLPSPLLLPPAPSACPVAAPAAL